ncbi:histone deacetylase RPD3 [Artomyces pyxidatus]|uniref:Histone deacetylase RPD3 n=1 Tax=Artomyces pyxidatus TaxID=48021 RepID=A0ACB8TJ57_9AGAM|nr:histone deacetylase RPD3 [Artomyces pyxidatus]
MSRRRVSYYYDPDVGSYSYGLGHPMKPLRMRITHELLTAYDMLGKMDVLRATRASPEVMSSFHTDEYVHFLHRVTPETAEELTYQGTRFLVGDDNPAFEGVFEFCSISAGGTIAAAKRITSGAADIAINWAGGLHHAKKREASGFCYINDIVLGILELLRTFPRVLYIDIDCHHGDGVEEAFYTTDRVMTCSFHKFGEYFPGTGTQEDRGRGKGRGYAVNVPLKDGLSDESFKSVFEPVIERIIAVFQPSVIVLQCGADSLSGDKLGCFNVTMQGHAHCVQFVRNLNIPFILVGGGGYTVKNASRTWAYETACALGIEKDIDLNLPWNEFFDWFGPRYRLEVAESNMEDMNLKDNSLEKVKEMALAQLSELQPAPSVGLQDVPRESVGRHLGLMDDDESESKDELDDRLAQHARFVYQLQESEAPEPASDESEDVDSYRYDSDDSSTSRRRRARGTRSRQKKRMSIMSNDWYDVPQLNHFGYYEGADDSNGGPIGKPRFFESGLLWNADARRAMITPDFGVSVRDVMERGGRMGSLGDEMEVEEEEEEV